MSCHHWVNHPPTATQPRVPPICTSAWQALHFRPYLSHCRVHVTSSCAVRGLPIRTSSSAGRITKTAYSKRAPRLNALSLSRHSNEVQNFGHKYKVQHYSSSSSFQMTGPSKLAVLQRKNPDDVVITMAIRSPLCKAKKGGFRDMRSVPFIIF